MKLPSTTPKRTTRQASRRSAPSRPLAADARSWRWYTGPGHQFPVLNERTLGHWPHRPQ